MNTTTIEQDLDHIRARLYEVRWLTADGCMPPSDQIAVGGSARTVLAQLIGDDTPTLIAALEQMTARAEQAEAKVRDYENAVLWTTSCTGCANSLDEIRRMEERAEKAERELTTALRKSIAQRAPIGGTR